MLPTYKKKMLESFIQGCEADAKRVSDGGEAALVYLKHPDGSRRTIPNKFVTTRYTVENKNFSIYEDKGFVEETPAEAAKAAKKHLAEREKTYVSREERKAQAAIPAGLEDIVAKLVAEALAKAKAK